MINHTQSYKRRNTSATTIKMNEYDEYDSSQTTETKIHLCVSTIQIALVLQSNTFIAPLYCQACFFTFHGVHHGILGNWVEVIHS